MAKKQCESKLIPINKILRPAETQMRVRISEETINEYAEARQSGARFPDIEVFGPTEDDVYILASGFHRVGGYEKAGDLKINATIYPGGYREAILHAVGTNSDHGLQRTEEDRRKCVLTLLCDKEWRAKPQDWVAKVARVRKQFVGDVKRELKEEEARARGETVPERPSRKAAKSSPIGSNGAPAKRSMEPITVEGSDRWGQVIPEDLKAVVGYANAGLLIAKAIRDHVAEVEEFRKTPGGVKVAHQSVTTDLRKAAEGIERCVFDAVCPECEGSGEITDDKEKKSKCPSCAGRAWLDKNTIAALPDRLVRKLKKAAKE